jgi:hypothetical protein
MENDIPCSCDVPTLQTIAIIVDGWRKEWKFDSEPTWSKVYREAFVFAQKKGERATTAFLDECNVHVREGRTILDSIREVVHTNCACCRERLKYDIILLYDLLVHVTAEVKFLEVSVYDSSIQ